MKTFNEFIKEKRLEREMTLREFCREVELDPSNWSKIERGADVPKSKWVLDRIAVVLAMTEEERKTMMMLAMIQSIPPDLWPEESILEQLPMFFRTVRTGRGNLKGLLRKLK